MEWFRGLLRSKSHATVETIPTDNFVDTLKEFSLSSWFATAVVAGCVCATMYASIQLLKARSDADRLQAENERLFNQTRQLIFHTSNLRKKSELLQAENDRVLVRVQNLETKILDVVSTIINQNPSTQYSLIRSVYNEQVLELMVENGRLKNKLEHMREERQCSVCMSQEANCVLKPCGHSICTECYYEIRRTSAERSLSPLCPFCRREFSEFIPKYNSL